MRPQVRILYRPFPTLAMIAEGTLRQLYCDRHLSMMEVARELKVTHATVLYWLKQYKIPRRSWSEGTYVKRNPRGDPFRIKTRLSGLERELTAAALALYWAEGNKNDGAIRIGNLDANLLRLFARFLRKVCRVEEARLTVYVRVNDPFGLKPARRYWAEQLGLPKERVLVYRHTDSRSNPTRQRSPYGVATLEFHNVKFRRWLEAAIQELLQRHLTRISDSTRTNGEYQET